jgi:uncharacterized protein YdhG (YjbR/CyaY superfamily)
MTMFKPVRAKSVAEYLSALPPERKAAITFLHTFIQKASPKFKPYFAYNMLGYGKFKYRNYKKEIIDWPIVALASQKNYMSVYVCALEGKQYIAEKHKKELGKVSVGRSCIRFKKLEDVDLVVLRQVLQKAAKRPGLTVEKK